MVYRQTPRSEALRAASRERILDAARTLFARKGYDATTMQDIVAEAETSIGNAYFYFKNKESLVQALTQSWTNALLDFSERLTASLPAGPDRIAGWIALNVANVLTSRHGLAQLLATDQRVGTINVMRDIAVGRWIRILSASLPDRAESELPLIAEAIWGSNRAVVESIGRGELKVSTKHAVEFLVAWNLRALGLPESKVDKLVKSSWRFAARHAREAENF